jgi:hypothetical protein
MVMESKHKVIFWASIITVLVALPLAGCGGSSIVGVYRCYLSPETLNLKYALVPHWRLELKSNGTYTQTIFTPSTTTGPFLPNIPTGSVGKTVYKTYQGTYTVRNNPKGQSFQERVVLNGEPASINTYQIIGRLRVHGKWVRFTALYNGGLWAKKPPPGTK